MGLNEIGELQPNSSDLVTGLVMMVANRWPFSFASLNLLESGGNHEII